MNVPKLRFKDNNGNDYPEWKKLNLSEICSFLQGLTYTPDDVSNTGILVLRSSNIQNDKISYLDNVFVKINIPDNLLVKENDILMCVRNGSKSLVGKNALITKKDLGNTWGAFMMIIRSNLPNKYIYYYLNTNIFNKHIFKDLGTATINQITKKMFQSFKICLPNLKEQQKIADFLSTVDKKIENLNATIENLEQQKKGLIQQIFSQKLRFKDENGNDYPQWQKKKLDEYVFIYDGTHQTPKYVNSGIKFVSVENIRDLFNTNKFISEKDFLKEFKNIPTVGDILMTRIGDVGTATLITKDEPLAYYVSLALFKRKKTIHMSFLLHYINTTYFQHELWKRTLHIAFPKKINKNEIGKCNLLVPCLEEQTKIADFLSAFDRKIDNQKAQLEHWKQIKKGLLQQMFV